MNNNHPNRSKAPPETITAPVEPVERGYNGWKNYETWNAALWIDNDGRGEYWRERADGPFGPRPGEDFKVYTDRLIAECQAKIAAERASRAAERQAIKAERLASLRRVMETGRVYLPSVPATSETDKPGLDAPLYWWERD